LLKCLNTKCKYMIHIQCAIDRSMIIPIDFMMDFYGLEKEKLSDCIPFYCMKHNRDLITAYKAYLDQLKQVLEITGVEAEDKPSESDKCTSEHGEEDHSDELLDDGLETITNWNISNLSHPEFNYNILPADEMTQCVSVKDEFYKVQKPTYEKDDSLIHISTTLDIPSPCVGGNDFFMEPFTKPMNDFNFAFVSKQFYDYYERDIKQIEEGGRSSITISEIRDLKEFFLKAIAAYKDYDVELSSFYTKLFHS
jgi:hypothetical protein